MPTNERSFLYALFRMLEPICDVCMRLVSGLDLPPSVLTSEMASVSDILLHVVHVFGAFVRISLCQKTK